MSRRYEDLSGPEVADIVFTRRATVDGHEDDEQRPGSSEHQTQNSDAQALDERLDVE